MAAPGHQVYKPSENMPKMNKTSGMGLYKDRLQEKKRKYAFDQEKKVRFKKKEKNTLSIKKKERKHAYDQEKY